MERLPFAEIAEQPTIISLQNRCVELFEHIVVKTDGELTARRLVDKKVQLRGTLSGEYVMPCARCGCDVPCHFDEEFEYQIVHGEEHFEGPEDAECRQQDVEALYLTEPEIDLEAILQEQIYLTLPMQNLCSSTCRGLCSGCGVNLNDENCICQADYSASPFAVLGRLKK